MHKITINREKCRGHAHCMKVAPELWSVKNGKAHFVGNEKAVSMAAADIDAAKRSALVCPEYAIDVLDEEGRSILGIEPKKDDVPVIKAHYDSAKEWVMDEKGFFTIKPFPEEGLIRVRYYNGKHQLTLVIEGKTAIEIYNTIVREHLVSRLDHAADLGAELQKAEIAMKLGMNYVQDSPLQFREKKTD